MNRKKVVRNGRCGMKRLNAIVFRGLLFTALCYGLCILVISLVGANSFNYIRSFSTGTKFLILGAFSIVGLPGILRALRNTKKLTQDIKSNERPDKDAVSVQIILYASGFEIVCVLGLLSFFMGFPIPWSIFGLIVGTLCKLYYVPIFLNLTDCAPPDG